MRHTVEEDLRMARKHPWMQEDLAAAWGADKGCLPSPCAQSAEQASRMIKRVDNGTSGEGLKGYDDLA